MKIWIKTSFIKVEIGGRIIKEPYLPKSKLLADALYEGKIAYSLIDLGDETCLCRVSALPELAASIVADTAITVLTDSEAEAILKSKYPLSELENLDIKDVEVDELAKAEGIDPAVRADIQVPTRGRQVLQSQEMHLLKLIANKKRIDIGDLEEEIELGKNHAHNQALARLRGSSGI